MGPKRSSPLTIPLTAANVNWGYWYRYKRCPEVPIIASLTTMAVLPVADSLIEFADIL